MQMIQLNFNRLRLYVQQTDFITLIKLQNWLTFNTHTLFLYNLNTILLLALTIYLEGTQIHL